MSGTEKELVLVLAEHIASKARQRAAAFVAGISGAQGSGKSTLAHMLSQELEAGHGLTAVTLSLDDLYLTKSARRDLGRTVHPLCATRGVPGTHDMTFGLSVLEGLKNMRAGETVSLPRFDKLADDRAPTGETVDWPPDIILFEGWCIGAAPQEEAALSEPVNELERQEDAEEAWRRWSNDHLKGAYQELWALLDVLIMIRVPDLAFVINARLQQEKEMAVAAPGAAQMSRAQIERFVAHYERLTRHIWATMPDYADVLLSRDAAGFGELQLRKN